MIQGGFDGGRCAMIDPTMRPTYSNSFMRAVRLSGLTLLFFVAVLLKANDSHAGKSSAFVAGQEWSIKSETPTTAKVIIDRVEGWRDKTVVHISIVDIPATQFTRIDHLPFEESALAASVDKLLLTGVSPPAYFEAGYQQWKDHNGGIYTITIMELLNTGLPN
jgi:hypothetical protein